MQQRTFFLGLLFILPLAATHAQSLAKREVNSTVTTVAELVREHYVLREEGEAIAAYLLKDLQEGRFYLAESLKQLDSIMTKSLREASQDFHLYTWNNYDLVKQLQAPEAEDEGAESTSFFNDDAAHAANFGFAKVEVLPDNIGYIRLSQINISEHSLETLYAAMRLVQHTQALIIDLRDNQGGGSSVGSVLETFFFEDRRDLLEFRSRNGQTELESTVPWL
ncbi:MAG TPA: hypothetical protein DCE41_29360, partial [Cytophagales bacterium]|nr:hypothetical protein [Cytophagales bacterium]